MSAPPYIPIFAADYVKDTVDLSVEEHGAYFLLILACWLQDDCTLPDDDRKLARICRVSVRRWKLLRATMEDFWTISNGRWSNSRLTKERVYANKKSNSARENARKRWDTQDAENIDSTSSGRTSDSITNSKLAAEQPQPQQKKLETNVSSATRAKPAQRKPGSKSFWNNVPDWVPIEPWQAFLRMRRDKRNPVNNDTAALLLKTLERLRDQGHDPTAVLNQSTENSWTGLFKIDPPKESRNGRAAPGADGFTAACLDAVHEKRAGSSAGEARRPDPGDGRGVVESTASRVAAGGPR